MAGISIPAIAQASTTKSASPKQKPMGESVYGPPWEQGEIRTCFTYSAQPFLLICDEDSLIKAIANHVVTDGMSKDEATTAALQEARLQTKEFGVQFIGKYPWVISSKPIPPGTPNIAVPWPHCSKDKIITCKP